MTYIYPSNPEFPDHFHSPVTPPSEPSHITLHNFHEHYHTEHHQYLIQTVDAIYYQGCLILSEPLKDIPEHTKVRVTIDFVYN